MKFINKVPSKNIFSNVGRSVSLLIFSVLLSVTTFGGSLIVKSLKNGLSSLEKRLGADIMVVPYEARTKESIESLLMNGNRTTFYMPVSNLEKIGQTEGIDLISPQIFLSSISAGCCSVRLQIIGFDPETDFTIQPWASESYKGKLGNYEILVGSKVTVPDNETLTFYNIPCKVKAQLKETGSGLDNAVYANLTTLKAMIAEASKIPNTPTAQVNPDKVISTLLIKVQDGYDVDSVLGDINLHNKKIKAIKAKSMTSDMADTISTVSSIVSALIAAVWVLCIVIMMIVFSMIMNERKKEFAVLRVIGVSKSKLSSLVMTEALELSFTGGLIGIILVLFLCLPFKPLIQAKLAMPYLMPNVLEIVILALVTLIISMIAGAISSVISAVKIAKQDTGLILRTDN